MLISKLPLLSVGVAGSVASSFGGIYTGTLQKLKHFYKDNLLGQEESHNDDWAILQKLLNNKEGYKYLKISGLDQIQKKSDKSPATGKDVKRWCQNILETNISVHENLRSIWQEGILDAAGKFCILKIKDKLEKPLNLADAEEDLKINLKKLKESGNEEQLDKELQDLKAMETNKDAENALKDWCGTTYGESYNDPNQLNWKLAQKYCQKTTESPSITASKKEITKNQP